MGLTHPVAARRPKLHSNNPRIHPPSSPWLLLPFICFPLLQRFCSQGFVSHSLLALEAKDLDEKDVTIVQSVYFEGK